MFNRGSSVSAIEIPTRATPLRNGNPPQVPGTLRVYSPAETRARVDNETRRLARKFRQ